MTLITYDDLFDHYRNTIYYYEETERLHHSLREAMASLFKFSIVVFVLAYLLYVCDGIRKIPLFQEKTRTIIFYASFAIMLLMGFLFAISRQKTRKESGRISELEKYLHDNRMLEKEYLNYYIACSYGLKDEDFDDTFYRFLDMVCLYFLSPLFTALIAEFISVRLEEAKMTEDKIADAISIFQGMESDRLEIGVFTVLVFISIIQVYKILQEAESSKKDRLRCRETLRNDLLNIQSRYLIRNRDESIHIQFLKFPRDGEKDSNQST